MHLDYPPIPYVGPLNEQLQPGAVIRAKGNSHSAANFFAIALQCGPSANFTDDIALYLSAAFSPPPRIIRNSLIYNQWGPEESFGGFPTSPGAPFELMILVEPTEFKIAVNGQHFTEYRHRIPFERISHVSLTGEVTFESFSIWYSASYQTHNQSSMYPTLPPPGFDSGLQPYPPPPPGSYGPPGSMPYPPQQHPFPPPGSYGSAENMPYPPQQYPPPPYSQGPYDAYSPQNDQHSHKHGSSGGGIGGKIGTAIAGVTGGIAANAIGNKLFGRTGGFIAGAVAPTLISNALANKGGGGGGCSGGTCPNQQYYPTEHKQKKKKKSALPIAGIAAGTGAAVLGATLLGKAFKHKSPHWGGHSSSSSSEEEEE